MPQQITSKGATVTLKKAVVTNAEQKAMSTVTWSTKKSAKGTKKEYAQVTTPRSGTATIKITRKVKRLYVKARLTAPATSAYVP